MTLELETSAAAFHSAFTDAPVAMAFVDVNATESVIRTPNHALVELLGYAPAELVGLPVRFLLHGEDLAAGLGVGLVDGSAPVQRWELRLVRSDGTDVWVQLHVSMLQDDAEHPIALAHVVDISERKEAEAGRERYETQIELMSRLRLRLLQGDSLREALTALCIDLRDRTSAARVVLLEHNPTIGRILVAAGSSGPGEIDSPVDAEMAVAPLGDGLAMALIAPEDELAAEDEALLVRLAVEVGEAVELARSRVERQRFDVLEDRERIATDLHDVVIQRLFAAGMRLQAAVPMVTGPARDRLSAVIGELDTTIAEIRDTIFFIHHPEREALTLSARVAETARANAEYLGFDPDLSIDGPLDQVSEAAAEQLIPALTEILSNVARHAEATTVRIRISSADDRLLLEVADDGIGMDPGATGGEGLGNLARRAMTLRGGFTAAADPDEGGTLVRWWVAD